jgi:hypothetical protein
MRVFFRLLSLLPSSLFFLLQWGCALALTTVVVVPRLNPNATLHDRASENVLFIPPP